MLINHRDPKLNVSRDTISEFVAGDSWGYAKFMHIEDVYKEDYLTQEDEKLIIKFYIRAPTYAQHARDQQRYIAQLEEKMKLMKENMEKYEKTCSEKGIKVEVKKVEPEPAKKSPVVKVAEASAAVTTKAFDTAPVTVPAPQKKSPAAAAATVSVQQEEKKTKQKTESATHQPQQTISLEDIVKNIEIDPKSDDEEDVECAEENGDKAAECEVENNDDEEEPTLPKEEGKESDASAVPSDMIEPLALFDENVEILREISNKYAPVTKIGKKVLLHIKSKKDESSGEEIKQKVIVVKKGSMSDRGSPESEKKQPGENVNKSIALYESYTNKEGKTEDDAMDGCNIGTADVNNEELLN